MNGCCCWGNQRDSLFVSHNNWTHRQTIFCFFHLIGAKILLKNCTRVAMMANRVYSYIIKENPTCCCFWWYDNVYTEENTRRKRPQTSTRQCNKKRKKKEKIDSTNVNFCRCCAAVVDFFSPLRSWIFIHQANVYMYRWCWNCLWRILKRLPSADRQIINRQSSILSSINEIGQLNNSNNCAFIIENKRGAHLINLS